MRTALALALLLAGQAAPEDPVKTVRVADDQLVELVAAEPQVVSPVAMAFDEDGRLYVAEMLDYPLGPAAGRIKLLEDIDGDGRYEKSTVFAEGLSFPTSVLPWKGGLLVTAGFEILYFKDGGKKALFTGFGRQNSQHLLNGLQFGLDGWIYGAAGLSGGKIGDVSINGMDFRFKPDTGDFEAVSGRSQFGNAFDDWGRRFVVRHDNHALHAVIPHRYLKRHPHLSIPSVEDSISDHGNIPRLYPVSPRDSVFTTDTDSSCGIAWHNDGLLVCEPVLNLVHRDVIKPAGASFTASRAAPQTEFFASTDPWSRPVNVVIGPDGNAHIADMYRAVIEHPDYIPKEIQPKLNHKGGLECGRIYRVRPKAGPAWKRPRLGSATPEELVALLDSDNRWLRLTAQRLLLDRRPDVKEALRKVSSPLGRAHALWTLKELGALEDEDIVRALGDSDPNLREQALILAEPRLRKSERLAKAATPLHADPSPRVRFQAALTLEDPGALVTIATRDLADRWTRAAILLSVAGSPVPFLKAFLGRAGNVIHSPGGLEIVRSLAEVVGRRRDAAETSAWLQVVVDGDPARWKREALTVLSVLRRAGADVQASVSQAGVSDRLEKWRADALAVTLKSESELSARLDSLDLAGLLLSPDQAVALEPLLGPREPQEVQLRAARILSAQPGPAIGEKLLDGWARLTPPVRRELVGSFLGRAERARQLISRMEKGQISLNELEPHQRDGLRRHADGDVRARAAKLPALKLSADREEVIQEIAKKLAGLKGDRVRGHKLFHASCASCHRLNGEGTRVGPDLEGAVGRDPRAMLVDLLDPNRAMDPSYRQYVVKTTAQETYNGVIATETPSSVTLRRPVGEEITLLRKDIAEIQAWPASMMPEGIENSLTAQDFADILEFFRRK